MEQVPQGGVRGVTRAVRKDELIRLLLAGFMLRECANRMQVSYWTVRQYVKEPGFMQELQSLSTEVYARVDSELSMRKVDMINKLEEASDLALDEMLSLMKESKTDIVRLKAAQDIMDRDSRISRTKRVESAHEHAFMNPLTLVAAANAAREVDSFEARKRGGEPAGDAVAHPSVPALPEAPLDSKEIN